MANPTEEQVIRLLSELPFPCYFGKDRDGVLEVQIPIMDEDEQHLKELQEQGLNGYDKIESEVSNA